MIRNPFKIKKVRPKEQRGPLLNTSLTLIYSLAGFCLMQLGLAEGRTDPNAPFLFDSPDLQTLTASAFIAVSVFLLFSGLRLALFTSKMIADLTQGPALLVGYVTTRETRNWRRSFGRQKLSYRLYLVSRQAFPLWLRGSAAFEEEEPYLNWSGWTRRLPVVVPSIFLVPGWAYEMVREGDLIRLHYARWQRAVLNVEVIESVLPPLPSPHSFKKEPPPPEVETAQWRIVEPDE